VVGDWWIGRECATNLFHKQLKHHFDFSVPKHIALQKMKEEFVVLERHWLIASTKEMGRKTKINKNNISQ